MLPTIIVIVIIVIIVMVIVIVLVIIMILSWDCRVFNTTRHGEDSTGKNIYIYIYLPPIPQNSKIHETDW